MYIRPCLACGKVLEGIYDKRVKYHRGCIPICKMEGCGKRALHLSTGLCADLCDKHHSRWLRNQPETNPCRGCGIMIDSEGKWCPDCKALRLDTKGNRNFNSEENCGPPVGNNADCPKRKLCRSIPCPTPEELIERRQLVQRLRVKRHVPPSSLYYEPTIYKTNGYYGALNY